MLIVKLHGSLGNLGGIVTFQKSLQGRNARSDNAYFHFQTGRVTTSRLRSGPLFRYLELALSYMYFPLYLLYLSPDVIEIHSSIGKNSLRRDYWYARIASFVVPGARLLLFNHGWNDAVTHSLLKKNRPWLVKYFGLFDCIIVLADRFRREIKAMGVSAPVEVITTAIDLTEFSDLPDESRPERKRLLFLSRLEKEKGVCELLDAVPALVARYPDLEICIAGSGSYEETARIHPAVLAHSANIRFFGYVRGHEKRELLVNSDVFIFPSYSEGCPISVIEALAAGLPLVYTPVGALPDLLKNGRNGIQVEPGSSKDIEKATLKLLDNPALMSGMAASNKELSKEFDLRVVHEKLERIYKGDS